MPVSALTTLYRSLTRHRLFAALNIGGLALGIAVFLVLFLFVRFEEGFDRVLPGSDRLWVVEERYTLPGLPTDPNPYTMGGELDQLRADFPDLEGTRFNRYSAIVRLGAEATTEDFGLVDANFFDLFRFPVAAGDPTATLADPDGLVITQKAATKYFGAQSPIGRGLTLVVDGKTYPYRVGAVLKDMPDNVTYKSELFARLVRDRFAGDNFDHWGSTSLFTVLRFPDAAAAKAFEARLPAFLERRAGTEDNFGSPVAKTFSQSLRPLSGIHLYTPAERAIVTTLGVVGLLTLLIAVVNYVNLATARASLRAREVALRKVLGGTRRALIGQFMGEAVATVALAALIGLALAELALPFVNTLGGTTLAIRYLGADGILLPLAALVLAVGLVAGLYPAIVLSRFRPAAVLASARAPGGGRAGTRLRAALVVAQFAIAIAFAIGTSVMIAQTAHVRAADLGFRRDGLILVQSFADGSLAPEQKAELLARFAALPGVSAATQANNAPGLQNTTNFSTMSRPGQPGTQPSVMWVTTGLGYFETYGARLLAGRLFDRAHPADDRAAVKKEDRAAAGANIVINTAAVRELGFASPAAAVGQAIREDSRTLTVIGVVNDVRFKGPRDPVPATVYFLNSGPIADAFAAVRHGGGATTAMTDRLEATWRRVAPGVPFKATTAENNLEEQYYKEDEQRSRLFTLGAVLAVAIGCIGLYGLAAFDTARRVKEIGIRKTLGASTADILKLLLGQFLRPVIVANLIAWPIAFFAMRSWLTGFDDRIALSPVFFATATLVALLIAVATIFGQAWRVSRAEPARALRHE